MGFLWTIGSYLPKTNPPILNSWVSNVELSSQIKWHNTPNNKMHFIFLYNFECVSFIKYFFVLLSHVVLYYMFYSHTQSHRSACLQQCGQDLALCPRITPCVGCKAGIDPPTFHSADTCFYTSYRASISYLSAIYSNDLQPIHA